MIKYKFPLGQDVHDANDILAMIAQLLTEKFTMGDRVLEFEQEFAKFVGAKYAMMTNSGSSANLLAVAALANHKYSSKLFPGDEVLIPAVCWSTSLYPLIQYNLKPVFVDTDPKTLNIDLDDLERKITHKTRALMAVHVLGNSCDMNRLMEIVKRYNLILIEDTCESLGTTFDGKYLGTFGEIGTFSTYYSHHLVTGGEGGMIVTNDDEIIEILKALRTHGWTRYLKYKDTIHSQHSDIDERFCFYNLGYNVRPLEIQAAMGLTQISKLKIKNNNRKTNYYKIKDKIESDPRNKLDNGQSFLSFPEKHSETDAIWFGVVLFLPNNSLTIKEYCNYCTSQSVETRPIISGNFIRQPVIKDLYPELNPLDFPGAEHCHFRGLFIGLPCAEMPEESITELVDILLGYQ